MNIVQNMKQYGLFLAPLINGDWMSGKASAIYRLNITDDHYSDEYLSIGRTDSEAVEMAANKIRGIKALSETD